MLHSIGAPAAGATPAADATPSPADGSAAPEGPLVLDNMVLPFPRKQLVFLPALFQVTDAGDEVVNGETCRVLDLALMPRIALMLKVQGWSARVWVLPDYKPAKIDLSKPGWHIAVLFRKLDFVPTLPPETWQPTPAESADVAHLTAEQLVQLAGLAGLKITH